MPNFYTLITKLLSIYAHFGGMKNIVRDKFLFCPKKTYTDHVLGDKVMLAQESDFE